MKKVHTFKQTQIGEIPEDWEILQVEEFADVVGGGTPSTKDLSNFIGNIPWITPRDLSSWTFKYISKGERNISEKGLQGSGAKLLPKDTVLLTSRAPIGYLAIASNELATNQGFKSLIPKQIANSGFIYYLLLNNIDNFKNNASGSTFQELSGGVLKRMKFGMPKLEEQQQIASILSSLDDKIELNRKMNKTLEEIGKAFFKRWFVDFEFPNENGDPYKSSGGEMVESELGEIPKGWKVEPLGKILTEIESGKRPKGGVSSFTGGIPSIGAENINGLANYDYSKEKYIPEVFFNGMKSGKLKHKDVLLYKDGAYIGKKTIYRNDFPHQKCCINEHVFILRCVDILQNYLYFWLDQEFMTRKIINLNSNAAQPGINQQGVKSLRILVPEKSLLVQFDRIIESILNKIYESARENNNLSQTRDILLPKLMSGKIRVN